MQQVQQVQLSAMPGSSHKSPIDKLDTPCLVRVLQYVSPQQQLVVCGAVCSKWRTATREAINSIDIIRCSQRMCDQLQQWLIHPPAALYKLSLDGPSRPVLRLQLSVLQHLKELDLDAVALEAIAADGSVLKMVDLLPKLQQCTKLTIRACRQPELTAAAAAFHAMPALQDLDIYGADARLLGSLVALPTTLTRLYLFDDRVITTTSGASICQLTGLCVLDVGAYGFDTRVLTNCAALEWVYMDIRDGGRFLEGFEDITTPLLAYANMPSLQHLHLRCEGDIDDPMATAAEVAALSASSNLTYLSLSDSEYCALPPAAYDTWFPAGRHCPYLQHVDMGELVLGNTSAVQRMVSACPGLQRLQFHSASPSDDQPDATCVAASLQALAHLTALARLRMDGRQLPVGVCISPAVIAAWSQMTSLQQLQLQLPADWWPYNMQNVLRLTQLRSLRELTLGRYFEAGGYGTLLAIKGRVEGSADVWRQLPSALWSAAIEYQHSQLLDLQSQQRQRHAAAAALLEEQKAAQTLVAALSQHLAVAEANQRAAALCQQHAEAQSQLMALQQAQAAVQAQIVRLLQQQQRADVEKLRQEQQEEIAAVRQQAEADHAQLQSQVSTLQAAVTALLQRKG